MIGSPIKEVFSKLDDISSKVEDLESNISSKIDELERTTITISGWAWRRYYNSIPPTAPCHFPSSSDFIIVGRTTQIKSQDVFYGPLCVHYGDTVSIISNFGPGNAPVPIDQYNGKIVMGVELQDLYLAEVTISAYTDAPVGLRFIIMDHYLMNLDESYPFIRNLEPALHVVYCGRKAVNGSPVMGCSDTAHYVGPVRAIYVMVGSLGNILTDTIGGDISITIRALRRL